MYIKIDDTDYTAIKSLSFAPQADLTGSQLPINAFSVDIYTQDDIALGQYAELYDDLDELWAKYWIIQAQRIDPHVVRLRAQSTLALLDRVKLDAHMYEAEFISDVLDTVIVYATDAPGIVATLPYALDDYYDNRVVTGFCPEQTARERLLWICFAIGAYVKTSFTDQIEINRLSQIGPLVPLKDTYLKPSLTQKDIVTAVAVKVYDYTAAVGDPGTTDKWVEDAAGNIWIETVTEMSLKNTDAPAGTPENVVRVENVKIVNPGNAADILTQMAKWNFSRDEVELDVIDNGSYGPGDTLQVYTTERTIREGWCISASFSFGLQAKARLKLTATEDRSAWLLVIEYKYGDLTLNTEAMYLPSGYGYRILNPYFDQLYNNHRIVYRPLAEAAEGTMDAPEVDDVEQYLPALDLDMATNYLEIISVDELTAEDGVVTIK